MNNNRLFKSGMLLCVAVLVGLGVYGFVVPTAFSRDNGAQPAAAPNSMTASRIIEVEMAEDFNRYVPDEAPVFEEDGLPAYGGAFVTQGYLYPAGTLDCSSGTCNGVLEDGSPEFPDKVIGEWTCWGYHIADGAHTPAGPLVVTTQLFDFGPIPGQETLVSIGYEQIDGASFVRAITGGTGRYYAASGEQEQQFLGFNSIDGITYRMAFDVR